MKGRTLLAALLFAAGAMASPNGGPVGDFVAHADVGSPKIAGDSTWNAASQGYTLSAGGVNIWAKRDEFQFAYRKMKGDFIVQAQVEFVGKGTDPHRKAGIMARASIDDFDSPYVDGAVHGEGLISLQFRKEKGADTAQTEMPAAHGATVIQLERTSTFEGNPWVARQVHLIDAAEDGIHEHRVVCSGPREGRPELAEALASRAS